MIPTLRKPIALATLLALALASAPALAAWPTPERGERFMVSSPDPLATAVGTEVLRRGGNAVDAAVAVLFTLAVTYPRSGGLGGGGFMLYRRPDGKAFALDFRETAPAAATRDMYLDDDGHVIEGASLEGMLAVGVPGNVAGLAEAHRRWGSRPWKELVAPARKLAARGFVVSPFLAASLAKHRDELARHEETAAVFLLPGGAAPPAGHVIRQPELARTLKRVAGRGADGFYGGEVARLIAEDMARRGGLVTADDLAAYRPVLREPLRGGYRGHEILSMPPPSSGGLAVLQILALLEGHDVKALGGGSSAFIHLFAEAERRAFADRAVHLGDPAVVSVPVAGLLDPDYLTARGADIDPDHATPSDRVGPGRPPEAATDPSPHPPAAESGETNHVSIVDAAGHAVSLTSTLNSNFGAKVMARGTGVLLNNQMDDFSAAPGVPNQYGLVGGEANAVAPGKRMLSSMAPTIVVRDREVALVLGSPGGSTIISTVVQVIVNTVDFGMDPMAAVAAPRVHHQWLPDRIRVEPDGLAPDVARNLEARGHALHVDDPMGSANVIGRDPGTGAWLGAADPRRAGRADGD